MSKFRQNEVGTGAQGAGAPKGGNVEADVRTRNLLQQNANRAVDPNNPLRSLAKGKKIVEVGPDGDLPEDE